MQSAVTPPSRSPVGTCPSRPAAPRYHAWRWAVLTAALAVAAFAAIAPAQALPVVSWPDGSPVSDKVQHVVGFAALGGAVGLLFNRVLMGLIGLLAFGALLEVVQATSGLGRDGDVVDLAANAAGLLAALLAILGARALRWVFLKRPRAVPP